MKEPVCIRKLMHNRVYSKLHILLVANVVKIGYICYIILHNEP